MNGINVVERKCGESAGQNRERMGFLGSIKRDFTTPDLVRRAELLERELGNKTWINTSWADLADIFKREKRHVRSTEEIENEELPLLTEIAEDGWTALRFIKRLNLDLAERVHGIVLQEKRIGFEWGIVCDGLPYILDTPKNKDSAIKIVNGMINAMKQKYDATTEVV